MRLSALLLAAALWPAAAHAQEAVPADNAAAPESSIRELPPPKVPVMEPHTSERAGAFSLRAGPYKPTDLVNDPSAAVTYEDVYGKGNAAMFAVDWEWQPLHHKYIGDLGLGVGAGFSRKKGKALKEDLTQSKQETVLMLIPATADITYRMELWADQPFVPYGGAGVDYWYFSEGKTGDSATTGAKRGWHWRAGGQFLLDFLEPKSAGQLDANWGINNTYLFGEYRSINMDGFGKNEGFLFSDDTWSAGLLFEY